MDNVYDQIESDYLFARPSFMEGAARIMDLSGSLNTYNYSRNGAEADARALAQDWRAIGRDVRAALEELRPESRRPETPERNSGRVLLRSIRRLGRSLARRPLGD